MKKDRIIIIFTCSVIFLSLFGCKSRIQYVPVESVRTEYKDRLQRDSIYVQDSVYIRDKGDTVFIDRWRYLYKDKLVTDTFIVSDTIQVPYPVEKQLSRWQQAKMDVGGWSIGALSGICICYAIIWLIKSKKKS